MGDRRGKPRFDVVGELWGTVETVLQFRVENIGRGGVLFHSHVPLPIDSVHQVRLARGPQGFTTQVKVRHVRAAATEDGRPSFVIGAAFLAPHPRLVAEIEQWAAIVADGDTAGA